MKPNKIDLKFWQNKKLPSWAPETAEVSIDEVINSHTERDRRDKTYVIHNTMNLLRRKRKDPELLRSYLAELVKYPGCSQGKKRSALAKKWLQRLNNAAMALMEMI